MFRFLLLLLFCISANALESHDNLLERVRQIQELELKIQNEALNWKNEKRNLELLLNVYENRNSNDKKSVEILQSEKLRLTEKLNSLLKQRDSLRGKLEEIDLELDNFKSELISKWHHKLPDSMKKLLPEELSLLSSTKKIQEKISAIESYVNAYLELQKQRHLLTEIHKFDNSEWQLNCLYLGTVQGYYMSQNGEKCGKIIYKNNKWEFVEDKSLLPTLSLAFEQMKQEGRPQLVNLPVELIND